MNTKNYCKAAFSQVDITPDFPVELIGCYRKDGIARSVLHPLQAQVLLFEHDNERYCLIAIDSLGLTTALAGELRGLVTKALCTDISCVMLNFSHTHSAPAPLSPVNGQRYFKLLCDRITACAKEALSALEPCLIAWSLGETDISENRREGCIAVDKRLGALKIIHAASEAPIALLLRVCAHANILMAENNKISSDYFGPTREKISAHFECPVMLIQGAAGNIKPLGVDKINGGNLSDVERISGMLLESAMRLHFEPKEVVHLAMVEREMELYSDVPSADKAKRVEQNAGMSAPDWLDECARLRAAGIIYQTQREDMHFFFLNEGCLCGVPSEIFCEISLTVTDEAQSPLVFFNGYTNGCTGYLPHREEWVKGGYETLDSYLTYYPFHGHVFPFRVETAERISNAVVEVWKRTVAGL